MSIGTPCCSDITVAMGRAVYGTPQITSNLASCMRCHMTSETCKDANHNDLAGENKNAVLVRAAV